MTVGSLGLHHQPTTPMVLEWGWGAQKSLLNAFSDSLHLTSYKNGQLSVALHVCRMLGFPVFWMCNFKSYAFGDHAQYPWSILVDSLKQQSRRMHVISLRSTSSVLIAMAVYGTKVLLSYLVGR